MTSNIIKNLNSKTVYNPCLYLNMRFHLDELNFLDEQLESESHRSSVDNDEAMFTEKGLFVA